MKFAGVLAAALLAVVAFNTTSSHAQLPPTRFYGSVLLNGEIPPVDTVVQAFIGSELCGEGVVAELGDPIGTGYMVDVLEQSFRPNCGTDGATVTFVVGGVTADQTGTFETGTFVQVDLTANGSPPAPPLPPGAEPIPEPSPEPAPEG